MEPDTSRLRVALRLLDWSEWSRQVIRGVQAYAHEKPHWQLYIAVGEVGSVDIYRSAQHWNGIIASVVDDSSAARRLMQAGRTHFVSFTACPDVFFKDLPSVRVDDALVAVSIGRHLLAGGFRQLAYFSLRSMIARMDYRAKALLAFAQSEDIPFERYSQRSSSPFSMRSLTRWVARLKKPVGIPTWNMNDARNVILACQRAGVAVPEEVAVVAWDDDAMVAESVTPSISAAVLPAERLGQESARLLDRLMSGAAAPKAPILVEPSGILHIRQSSDVSTIADREVILAMQYLRKNAAKPVSVPDLVELLQVSRRKLELDFLRATGQTVYQAIIHSHMERARQLLVETTWPIKRVADQSGFGTKQQFHRVFEKLEGVTPSKYRVRFAK